MLTTTIIKKIILIDGSFYIHRAYYAFPKLYTQSGLPTWVIYGVIHMIKSLLKKYKPTHMLIIFDAGGKTFRHDLFPQYKSNRKKMPNDLYIQIEPLHQIITAMGLPTFKVPYVEADDIIGTLAMFYAQLGNTILISTGDKDIAQIVSPNISLINTASNTIINFKEIKKKFGVPPTLITDYLALTGDRSDNIPGVPGIGKKTSQLLLNNIGNLITLYNHLNKIYYLLNFQKAKTIENTLKKHKDIAFLSYKLATIKKDMFLNISDSQLSIQQANINLLISLFNKYEFKKWIIDLQKEQWINKHKIYHQTQLYINTSLYQKNSPNKNLDNKTEIIKIIYDIQSLSYWIEKINSNKIIIFNIHTDTHNIFTAKIIGITLSTIDGEIAYIPIKKNINHNQKYNNTIYLCTKEFFFIFKKILENPKIKKISQNLKFHYTLLNRYDINPTGMIFDVTLEFYILYGTSDYQNIKRFLDSKIFNAISKFKMANDLNSPKNTIIKNSKNIQLQSEHAAQLIHSISHLHYLLWPKIQKNEKLKKLFEEIETPLIYILSRIESYGVLIDQKLLESHSLEIDAQLNVLEKEAHQLLQTSINLDSTKQLQTVLYEQQKLPILKKTPHGAPSTNEEVLKKLAKKYIAPNIILKYRSLSKLKSTYTSKLTTMINKKSNRIHTSYNQTKTTTGRLSSTNPNLQNIPNRNYDGRKIRKAFIAQKNFLIISADYSQIELRIMAHLSHDEKLINDFLSGKDIHASTAAEIFFTALHLVTHAQRHQAKIINFGLIYGMTAFGLSRQLSVTCKEAQQYVNRYFKRYPGIMDYIKKIKYEAYKNGYVSTINGRKLYLPNIYSNNISQKKSAERSAINAPMQGSAADIIKKAMVSINYWLQKENIPIYMIMQVHDELVFEVKNNIVDFAVKKIKKIMEECFILNVPLKVDIGIGKNWEQAH